MIPSVRQPETARMNGPEPDRLTPGTWWRLTDPDHEIAKREWERGITPPAHGIVLLLAETHVVDGEVHAVTLHGHPLLRMGRVKLLQDAFLRAFAPCPDGEALRAAELAAMMGEIQTIGASMSDMPGDEALIALYPPKPKAPDTEPGSEEAAVRLPAALLPSGDVTAAQAKIERGVAILEARSAWVKTRTDEMQHGMKIVQSYQEERVAQSLAGISEQRKMAENLLKNVHTMRLFLGEGVEVETLLEGESAPADEPLHLMQRMLYLDEEIFVSSVMDEGFHAGNMRDLPALLSANPDLLGRMLPHPRCVAIARIRRERREFDPPEDILDALRQIEKGQQDMFVQILIRDGSNVRMVMADEETSRAARLFPSRAEIDAIFTDRSRFDWEKREYKTREITPFDIEYSEKRGEHDRRALFYKRFLIILWGLQERKQVFGPFIPQGANWLEETTHNRHFRFVHDEENVLGDGLKPVSSWITEMNDWIRPGSRVLVQGARAMSPDSAPTAYGEPDRTYDRTRERDPVERLAELTVGRRGAELIVQLPTRERYGSRRMNTPLTVREADGRVLRDGVLCLDRADSATLRRYINSRQERASYLRWLALFMGALPIVEARERADRALVSQLERARPELSGALPEAVRLTREAGRGEISPQRVLALADRLGRAASLTLGDPGCQLRMRANGDLVRITGVRDPRAAAIRAPLLEATVLRSWSGADAREGASRLIPFSHVPELGETVIRSRIGPEETASARAAAAPGLRDPAAFELLRSLCEEGRAEAVRDLIERAGAADPEDLETWLKRVRQENHESNQKMVQIPSFVVPAGVALMERPGKGWTAWALRVALDPVLLAFRAGRADLVGRMCTGLYRKPEVGFERLRERAETDRPPLTLELSRLNDTRPLTAAGLTEPGWTFEGWDPVLTGPVRFPLEGRFSARPVQGPELEVAIPDGVLPAIARTVAGSLRLTPETLAAALEAARAGALIVAPGVESMLDRVLRDVQKPEGLDAKNESGEAYEP